MSCAAHVLAKQNRVCCAFFFGHAAHLKVVQNSDPGASGGGMLYLCLPAFAPLFCGTPPFGPAPHMRFVM